MYRAYPDAVEGSAPGAEPAAGVPADARDDGEQSQDAHDGQSQPSWANMPRRSLTARISVTLPRSRVKIQICSTSKWRSVGFGMRGWNPVCVPLATSRTTT